MDPEEQEDITPDAEQAMVEEEKIPGRHWYAIHTYSGYENKVKTHLEARIASLGMKVKGGQRRTVTRKVYPGYVLVDMVLDDYTWHVVRETPGVTGFVGGTSTE